MPKVMQWSVAYYTHETAEVGVTEGAPHMLVCKPLEMPTTEEHMRGMSIIGRRETRQVVYFMACGTCGDIHRIEFNSIEEENEWFKHRAS